MSHFGSSVEYALHCLLYLIGLGEGTPPSSKDLAEFQGVSPSYVAKVFTRLQQAGIVTAAEGVKGGFRLARPAETISVLEVVDAIEGHKPIFDCKNIRAGCILFDDNPPPWATAGVCGIHAVMLKAEAKMRASLAESSLLDLASSTAGKIPKEAIEDSLAWFGDRAERRQAARKRTPKDL